VEIYASFPYFLKKFHAMIKTQFDKSSLKDLTLKDFRSLQPQAIGCGSNDKGCVLPLPVSSLQSPPSSTEVHLNFKNFSVFWPSHPILNRKRDLTNRLMMQCTKRGSSGVTSYPGTRCLSTSWGTSLLTCQVFSRSLSFESFSAFLTSLISHLQPRVFCFMFSTGLW